MQLLSVFQEIQEAFSTLSPFENELESTLAQALTENKKLNFNSLIKELVEKSLKNEMQEIHFGDWFTFDNTSLDQNSYYYDKEGKVYCIHCNKVLEKKHIASEKDSENGKWVVDNCDCEGYKKEVEIIKNFQEKQTKLKKQLSDLFTETDEKLNQLREDKSKLLLDKWAIDGLNKLYSSFDILKIHNNKVIGFLKECLDNVYSETYFDDLSKKLKETELPKEEEIVPSLKPTTPKTAPKNKKETKV
jgi:hypothetical protein